MCSNIWREIKHWNKALEIKLVKVGIGAYAQKGLWDMMRWWNYNPSSTKEQTRLPNLESCEAHCLIRGPVTHLACQKMVADAMIFGEIWRFWSFNNFHARTTGVQQVLTPPPMPGRPFGPWGRWWGGGGWRWSSWRRPQLSRHLDKNFKLFTKCQVASKNSLSLFVANIWIEREKGGYLLPVVWCILRHVAMEFVHC